MNAAKQAATKKAVETRARRQEERQRERERLGAEMRRFQRDASAASARANRLELALEFSLPILVRVADGGSWSLEGQGGDAARDAVRMAKRALELPS